MQESILNLSVSATQQLDYWMKRNYEDKLIQRVHISAVRALVKDKWDDWISVYHNVGMLLTDRGAEFNLITDVPRARTSAYRPQGNGKIERFHLELARHLSLLYFTHWAFTPGITLNTLNKVSCLNLHLSSDIVIKVNIIVVIHSPFGAHPKPPRFWDLASRQFPCLT